MTWAYAPSYARPLSVPQGVATLFPRFGMDVVIAHPPGFDLMPEVLEKAQAAAAEHGTTITFADSMEEAFEGADAVYPKSWGRLDAFTDESKALAESGAFADWICDEKKIALATPTTSSTALPAGRPRPRGHRRRHGRPALGRSGTRRRTACTSARRSWP